MFFYKHSELGPELIRRLPIDREITILHSNEQIKSANAPTASERITFVAAHGRLLKAAESEKLDVLNIETADVQ